MAQWPGLSGRGTVAWAQWPWHSGLGAVAGVLPSLSGEATRRCSLGARAERIRAALERERCRSALRRGGKVDGTPR